MGGSGNGARLSGSLQVGGLRIQIEKLESERRSELLMRSVKSVWLVCMGVVSMDPAGRLPSFQPANLLDKTCVLPC